MMKSGVPGSVRRRIFARDGYACQCCGIKGRAERCRRGGWVHPTAVAGVYLSIDHRLPRIRGGDSSEGNLVTLCTRCNTLKGTKASVGESCS